MENLIITMILAYNNYNTGIGFTKSDIDSLILKHDFFKTLNCNERGYIILWKNKYITNEQFANYLDLEYEDDKFWIVCDGFSDILSNKYDSEIFILDGEDSSYGNSDYYDHTDIKSYWKDYTTDTLNSIIKCCIKNGYEIEDELMTKENTILKNGKIYFNDTELVDYINEDELDELKTELNIAICEAQEDADRNEVYDSVKRNFEKEIGEFKRKNINIKDKEVEKLYVNVNVDFDTVEEFLKNNNEDYDFVDTEYGSLLYVLKEMEFFDFRTTNYNEYGSIDDELLNEYTRNRLDWI